MSTDTSDKGKILCLSYGSRRGRRIEWIVCHYPAAPGWSAKRCADYYRGTNRIVSAHFAVDQNGPVPIVPLEKAAYHCATDGIDVLCGANNLNSIGIDLMDEKLNRRTLRAEDPDWYIPESTLYAAAALISSLMKSYDIPIENVVRHYDVTGKWCPRPLMGDDINRYYNISGNARWEQFKLQILRELEK